jgi:hypothetical protein
MLGVICFELLHKTPEEVGEISEDQIQFARAFLAQREKRIAESVEYEKWKADHGKS